MLCGAISGVLLPSSRRGRSGAFVDVATAGYSGWWISAVSSGVMKTILFVVAIAIAHLPLNISAECLERAPEPSKSKSQTDVQAEIQELLSKLQTNPNSSFLHNQLAILYGDSGNFSGFVKEMNTAIKLQPKDPINYFQASLTYGQNGRQEKQVAMLEKAIALDSNNPVFRFERARIYESKGRPDRAKKNYLDAKQLLAAVERGNVSTADHVLRDSRAVKGTYFDSFNNAYTVEHLEADIEKALARISK
jgi:tetratricopeptide (TPR) repeat protein